MYRLRKALELVDHHLRHRGIEVVRDPDSEVLAIFADRQKLRQVILNLLTNAADAMSAGGNLRLSIASDTLAVGKKAVRIEFADTGAGIAPENLARVTEPFFTTK